MCRIKCGEAGGFYNCVGAVATGSNKRNRFLTLSLSIPKPSKIH